MTELKIYSVSDRYIAFLRQDLSLSNVFDNKENQRSHTRKYLGVAFQQNSFNYFIPFSSPKNSDYYTDENGIKSIRKSIVPIIRMTAKRTKSRQLELIGTLKISNMIPVPDSELMPYHISDEVDLKYRDVVLKEYDFIKSNTSAILKNARVIYNQKTKASEFYKDVKPPNYLNSTVSFSLAEKVCNLFIKSLQTGVFH